MTGESIIFLTEIVGFSEGNEQALEVDLLQM